MKAPFYSYCIFNPSHKDTLHLFCLVSVFRVYTSLLH